VTFFALSSKLPAQPTQNKISGVFPSALSCAIVGTFMSLRFHKALPYVYDVALLRLLILFFQSLDFPSDEK
jgi:hypothetical protein